MTTATGKLRFWCDMSMECIRRDHTSALSPGDQRGPFLSARAIGMALAALNDARAYVLGSPALLSIPAPATLLGISAADADTASAAACAQVLRLRYPNQAHLLEPAWLRWLDYFGLGLAGSPAETAGRDFGTLVHQSGMNDPIHAEAGRYTPSGDAYSHMLPPKESMQGYAGGHWGMATPLLATSVTNFPPPPGRVSATTVNPTAHYAADFAKVVAKGGSNWMPGTRTLPEEITGIAWGYDGPMELGTPPRLYLQVALTVLDAIEAKNPGSLSPEDELAIIAGVAIAMADAGIDAWHYKYAPTHMMWRPVVGIRNAVPGNGVSDPDWEPLGRPDTNGTGYSLTPNFPAYPSGHATFGAAAFQLLRLFLVEKKVAKFDLDGVDDIRFDFVSDEFDGRNKDPITLQPREHITLGYGSLWQAIVDNSVSRVYLGVHWEFDGITKRNVANTGDEFGVPSSPSALGKTGGVWLGAKIANEIAVKLGVSSATIIASKIL
ncbi:MAG: vanadium-dependent haloperoxidase [Nitrosomonas sp.]